MSLRLFMVDVSGGENANIVFAPDADTAARLCMQAIYDERQDTQTFQLQYSYNTTITVRSTRTAFDKPARVRWDDDNATNLVFSEEWLEKDLDEQ